MEFLQITNQRTNNKHVVAAQKGRAAGTAYALLQPPQIRALKVQGSIELLSTGIRLLGIYVFLSAIRSGTTQYQAVIQFQSISQDDIAVFAYVGLIQVALMVITALFMVKFPISLAKWILPKTKDNEVALDGSVKDIEVSLFAVMGVYTFMGNSRLLSQWSLVVVFVP